VNSSLSCKHVLITIPVLLIGGTELQTLNLVRVLLSAAYQVTVCCYHEYDQDMVSQVEATGARVSLMGLDRSDGIVSLVGKLKTVFRELNPDIVHVQYVAPGFLPILVARLAGVKTIFGTVHQPGRTYGWKAKVLLRSAAKLCTAFFCVSESTEKSWFGESEVFDPDKGNKRRSHFTIYNAVDIKTVEDSIAKVDPDELRKSIGVEGSKAIGIVARLRREKGHAFLFGAMSEVIKKVPDAVLLVVGDGPDREKLKGQAENIGIADNVIWLGQKNPEDVYKLYSIMDVVAVPSVFEGFGLSAAEAMAAGVPLVGTRVDGLTEIIEDGVSGYLVAAGDTKSLAQCLMNLLSEPEKAKAMGQKGQEIVKERFSMERFDKSIRSLYERYGG